MREIICIHIGQGGIQLGNACWELFCLEHGISPEGTPQSPKETTNDAYRVFFEENKLGKHIPRNIYIDLDEDIINEARTGKYRKLFHPDQLISGKGGASNNYARGYSYMKYVDISLNKIRQMADNSDNLEGFIIFNSISGGTGSGLGTLLLEEISTTYESKKKLGFQIFGSPHTSTSSTESYNSMLNLHSILEHMDASIIIDNNAVYDMCRNTLELTSYIYMNSIIAQSIASQTASFRYSGTLLVNANMSEFLDNLVHYPRIKFLLSSYSPILSINKCIHESMSAFDITDWAFQPTSMMAKCNPAWGKYLAVCLMYRGDVAHRDINAAISRIMHRRSVQFASCCPTRGFKSEINFQPSIHVPGSPFLNYRMSLGMISNSTAIKEVFRPIGREFDSLYMKRAFVHLYISEGLEEESLLEARLDLLELEKEYAVLEIEDKEEGEEYE